MKIELKVPEFGESVQEVHIAKWLRQEGDQIARDEDLVELETDKATMELAAPSAGVIMQIVKPAGEIARIGEVIAFIDDAPVAKSAGAAPAAPEQAEPAKAGYAEGTNGGAVHATPAARRELRMHGLEPEQVSPGAKRVERQDVLRYVAEHPTPSAAAAPPAPPEAKPVIAKEPPAKEVTRPTAPTDKSSAVEVVPMTMIRKKIAERLVSAQHNAALLTTFNEIDMTGVMELRQKFGESFKQKHGIKLGFMAFFVKAAIEALQEFREINAEIRGTDIVYHKHQHIGVAIGSDRGLVVPVLKKCEELNFAEIEKKIGDFAKRSSDGKLLPDELQGGTFTISNGGVYGSLLSTPIVNPPQSGVLGMHAIQERPIAKNGQVVIRPMMYIALTYDHRIVDGRGAVSFLKKIKDVVEDPIRLLFEV